MKPAALITSAANPLVKHVRALEQKKYREETKLFLVEGVRHVVDALQAGFVAQTLIATPQLVVDALLRRLLKESQAERAEVSLELARRFSGRDNAEDIFGIFEQRYAPPAALQQGVWVVLEQVRDAGNLGTIVRTIAAAGGAGLVLVGACCDVWSSEAIRASVGAFARVPVLKLSESAFMQEAQHYGGQIIGTHVQAKQDFRQLSYQAPLWLVMGSEHAGLTPQVAGLCRHLTRIPMHQAIESLNLATATALMLYEAQRSRL